MAFRLGVDVGGTFTDLFLVNDSDDRQFRVKTPSTPADPSLGVLTGVKRICEEAGIAPSELRNIVHGTTVATNAVLESKGARVGLITTTGFKQILHLARSQTPGPLAGWIIMIKPDPPALAGGHARGDRAPRRARQHRHAGRPRAGQGHRARPRRLRRRVAHRRPDQLVRQQRATRRRSGRSSRSSTRASRSRSARTCCPSSASTSARSRPA